MISVLLAPTHDLNRKKEIPMLRNRMNNILLEKLKSEMEIEPEKVVLAYAKDFYTQRLLMVF